jgi:UDP-N-acetyl-D-glucosamine dehydrogenase
MKNKKICIIGLGYVGELLFSRIRKHYKYTIGFDINEKKIKLLKIKYKKSRLTKDINEIKNSNIYIICVPTPLDKNKNPDISYIQNAVETISKIIKKGDLIILESTCYPGCTKDEIVNIIEKKNNFKFKKDFFVCFSPERINPGKNQNEIFNSTKVLGSPCVESLKKTKELYKNIFKNLHIVKNFEEAELSKLIENTFRQINISFMNEMAILCQKLNLNLWNALKAAETKEFGFMKFIPGHGTGGHCIPIDPSYLQWKAKSENLSSRFIELSNEINAAMPQYIVSRIINILNNNSRSIKNSKILIIGLTYKKNVDDYRESAAVEIFKLLLNLGGSISFHDNYVKEIQLNRKIYKSVSTIKNNLKKNDLVVALVDHDYINWKNIYKYSKYIFDSKNIFEHINYYNKKVELL